MGFGNRINFINLRGYLTLFQKTRTLWKLGIRNLIRVAYYRFEMETGRLRSKLPMGQPINGSVFIGDKITPPKKRIQQKVSTDAALLLAGKLRLYSNKYCEVQDPPLWFSGQKSNQSPPKKHWSQIPDFDDGDIKNVWEISRLHWLVLAAQALRSGGSKKHLSLINRWLEDWSQNNPVNNGPNWKCAQEASIRLFNLLLASYFLQEVNYPSDALVQLVREHCERINATLYYGVAQDNNHGISEAAALFIAGAWLRSICASDEISKRFLQRGRDGLEERVGRLVAKDGSFSQHSVNYHRLLLDTLSLVEFWRLRLRQPKFSDNYYVRTNAATRWLWQMVDPETGKAPNLGANDGALLLQLTGTSYRDFRPSVQLAGALFLGVRFYTHDDSDIILQCLDLPVKELPVSEDKRKSRLFSEGGFVTFAGGSCWGILRFPKFQFRPSHADLMHLEISDRGTPIIRDGGSFSYNTDDKWMNYFPGIESHNTIQFDDGEPMPRIGRFLFSAWPWTKNVDFWEEDGNNCWNGKYTDYRGCTHERHIVLKGREWNITDRIYGFVNNAVLRWRLAPSDWRFDGQWLKSTVGSILIEVEGAELKRIELVDGWESSYYNEMTQIPVLEVKVCRPCLLKSTIVLPELCAKVI